MLSLELLCKKLRTHQCQLLPAWPGQVDPREKHCECQQHLPTSRKSLWCCPSWVRKGPRESPRWREQGSPGQWKLRFGSMRGGLNTVTMSTVPGPALWSHTTQSLSVYIWHLPSHHSSVGVQDECLRVSESVHKPFMRTPGFPEAFCFT